MVKRFLILVASLVAAFALAAGFIGTAVSQETMATPDAAGAAHPAHIHSGTCPDVGDVVFPLSHVTAPGGDALASPDAADIVATPEADGVTLVSTTTVDASLDDILAAEHAINVHQSDEQMSVYIACRDITGTADGGELELALEEQNDSGASGTATLTDNGDGTTTVVIELTHGEMGTPIA
jgi:hypothetical protein